MRPVVCMITDSVRLRSDELSGMAAPADDRLLQRIALAARAGVHLVQVRERHLDGGPLLAVVRASLHAVRNTSTRIIVNERLDVALVSGAHGVHLRGDSMPAWRVRRLAPAGFLIGRSVHNRDEAIRAEAEGGLDYLMFGPVFPTRSKPGAAGAGEAALAAVVEAVRLPVLAVGGATWETAPGLARAGAAGFAGIGLFTDGQDGELGSAIVRTCDAFDTR